MATRSLSRLRSDEVAAATAASFVLLVIVDRLVGRASRVGEADLGDRSLAAAAATGNVLWIVVALVALVALARFGRRGLTLGWRELDRGEPLQWMAGVLVVLLAWRYATTGYDYVFAEWHWVDRFLLVVSGLWAIWKPVFLPLFVFFVRVLQQPFRTVLDFSPGQNIDDLLVLALLALAGFALYGMATGSRRSVGVLPVLASLVAAQFFVSGRGKLRLDWLQDNELGNLPLNGFHQGWLASTNGSLAERLSDALSSYNRPVLILTLVLELGAVVAVVHRRLLVAFLFGWIGFHLATFAALGFSFLEWIALHVMLVLLISSEDGIRWSRPAFSVVPVVMAVVVVVAGGRLFDPPSLAWLDSPLVYRYDITAIDERGDRRPLESRDFEPYDHLFAFSMLDLGPSDPLVSGYGAANKAEFQAASRVGNVQQLAIAETVAETDGPEPADAIFVLTRFLASTREDDRTLPPIQPPPHFWTDRPDADYDRSIPLTSLSVDRVTVLRVGDTTFRRREPVVVIDWNDGEPTVTVAEP